MMGSVTALLTGAAQTTATAGATDDAPTPEGLDFLLALLAAAPVASADATAVETPLQPVAQDADEAASDTTNPVDLAAMIAALLPVAATPAANAPATDDGAADAAAAGAAATPANSTAQLQLLERLAQANASAEQAPPADATTGAPPVPPHLDLQQLLRTMSRQLEAPEPEAAAQMPVPPKAGKPVESAAAPQVSAAATVRGTDVPAALAATATPKPDPAAPLEVATPSPAQTQPLEPLQAPADAQAQAQFAAQLPPNPAPVAANAAPTVHAPVGTPRWADELGSRMVLMSLRGQHEGSLNLTPDHLGPLEVRVSVNQGTANVWFGAQHADTRAALAEALPRLRELFAGAGLTLGHAGVSQEAPRQSTRDSEATRFTGPAVGDAVDGLDPAAPATRRVALGLVDTYA